MGRSKFAPPVQKLCLQARQDFKRPPLPTLPPAPAERQGQAAQAVLASDCEELGAIFALRQAAVVAAASRPPEPLPDSEFEVCQPAPFTQGSSNPGHFSCDHCWTTRSTRFSRHKGLVLCKRCGQHLQRWGVVPPLDKQCAHCGTLRSGYWRKLHGQTVCNACGVYPRQQHSKGKMRPLGRPMKQGRPQKKQKHPAQAAGSPPCSDSQLDNEAATEAGT